MITIISNYDDDDGDDDDDHADDDDDQDLPVAIIPRLKTAKTARTTLTPNSSEQQQNVPP